MQHAYIVGGVVVEILQPFARLEADRPPAPVPLAEGQEVTPEEQTLRDHQQKLHDDYAAGPVPLAERYHPDFLALVREVADDVRAGWVASGEGFAAPEPPAAGASVPTSVTRAQAKLALLDAGLLDDVEDAIDGMQADDKRRALIEWNERDRFERESPFLMTMAGVLGLDDEALDALFVDAANR